MATENDHGLSEEELAQLTEEERAGLEADTDNDDNDDDDDEDGAGTGNGGEGGGDDEGDNAGDPAKPDAGEGKPNPADAGRDDGGPANAPEIPASVEVPLIRAEGADKAKARLSEIRTEQDKLEADFEDGEITAKEFKAGLSRLNDEAADLRWTLNKAELSAEVAQQQQVKRWYDDVGEFLAQHPEVKSSKLKLTAFDAVVREVTANPENQKLSNRKQLEKAHEIWASELGIQTAARKDGGKGGGGGDKAAGKRSSLADRGVPPTLGKVPAADLNDTDDGAYAALDRLAETDPLKFEETLGKMSEAEQDAYLAAR